MRLIAQVASDLAGAAAHVAYLASSVGLLGEAVEQFAIERLVPQFVEDSAGIFLGEAVVAFADRVDGVVVQW